MKTEIDTVDAVVKYMYNTPPMRIFHDVYGRDHHESYVAEKLPLCKNLTDLWGALDEEHRLTLINCALNRR